MLKVEIELTTECQASCPMCARNINSGMPNPHLEKAEWSYDDFIKAFDDRFLNRIETITFCGVFGDPLICKDVQQIVAYLKEKDIELIIHTNGSIRSVQWWAEFAKVMPTAHRVIFGVDGLVDTHHFYRVGTNFNKIVDNIKSFTNAGGIAQVQFLEFDHNKHQYEELCRFFNSINVQVYRVHSNRFRNQVHNVVDKTGTILYQLKPSKKSELNSYNDSDLPLAITASVGKPICCASLDLNSVYVDSKKQIWPCCETATIEYTPIRLNQPEFNKTLPILKSQIKQIQLQLGTISLLEKPALDILSEDYWNVWNKHWKNNTSLLCKLVCSKFLDV